MSMFRCYWCDNLRDSKRDLPEILGGELICGYCFNNLQCNHCGELFCEEPGECDPDSIVLHGKGFIQHYHADCWIEVRKVITADAKRDEMREER